MESSMKCSVERVIDAMHKNLGEQLTIDDMARIAMFSKFHFSRTFRAETGMSPGRFLSALRLEAAKRLLLSTALSVADISNRVGYSSVGTFSTRFKAAVGVAPTVYRATGGHTAWRAVQSPGGQGRGSSTVSGHISFPVPAWNAPVFVGLFPDVVPQGAPVRCAELRGPGNYLLEDVPNGVWHVLACSAVPAGEPDGPEDEAAPPLRLVGGSGPLAVGPGLGRASADMLLRRAESFDPPVLVALAPVAEAERVIPVAS
ncbi:helix-turn-helix transcriptional regulator [Streptomyces sedi]|uniref:Helix-turn-helix transcriptional regulator n=3 Tax=Streptomyces sedi TaxID=555059 RepID=A0A5C4VFG1_9ACTN|nr:AraC family transcriptional regulator [Streptomyces sedi]TNM34325.1 helix-turn-helix transcriptional regulator [Streptomyces sedi]